LGLDGLSHDEWVQIIIFGSLGLYLATAVPRLFRGRFMAGVAALIFWAGLLGVTLVAYGYRFELRAVGERVLAVAFPGTAIETAPKEITVFRQPDGQFTLVAQAGRTRVSFVLDTGASTVVLRAEDAARLGIPVKTLAYDMPVATANGHAMTAAVTLPELRIGDIVETDVDALVARKGSLHQNLLGMTFLNRLASFTFANDRLVLRGP
jgi:aspartyl protease family protein